jgi:hypothetical protein
MESRTDGMKIKSFIALLSVSLVTSFAFASDAKTQQEGIALIQQAVDKTNIFELPGFTLKAKVTVNSKGKDVDGTYELFWNGPDQWREQIQFPDYGEIRVGGKGVVFTKRSLDFTPVEIYEVRSTLGFGTYPLAPPASIIWLFPQNDEAVKKIHDRKIEGQLERCVEIENKSSRNREVCVANSTGTPLRSAPFGAADIQPAGSKVFPRMLTRIEHGHANASVRITELSLNEPFPAKAFDVPEAANSEPGCMNPKSAAVIRKVPPSYPSQDRVASVQGMVYIYSIIGTDGVPRNTAAESGPSLTLEKAATEAFQQWRFEPATCLGNPVEGEMILGINFSLSP